MRTGQIPRLEKINPSGQIPLYTYIYILVRGTWPFVGQALQHAWGRLVRGTGPSTCLGHARSWDRPFNMLGASPLLGQALQHAGLACSAICLGYGPIRGLMQWDDLMKSDQP